MGGGAEFDLVRRMLAVWGDLAQGVGSDAAVLEEVPHARTVVSVDSSVEGVHFRREWMSPTEIGYRATAAALSDLAAAGARPTGVMLALGIPPHWLAALEELAQGIADAVGSAGNGARIIGGDTTRATELTLGVTVIGNAARPLARVGATPGNLLVLTGDIGRSRRALQAFGSGAQPEPRDRVRFVHPEPRLGEGAWLAEHGATAAIDISDGLASELAHLAAASAVGFRVDLSAIPVCAGIDPLEALQSGEEYELLATVPPDFPLTLFGESFSTPLTVIGSVCEQGEGVRVEAGGQSIDLPAGHNHF
jgi:thiamine-monophosphate kinase